MIHTVAPLSSAEIAKSLHLRNDNKLLNVSLFF